MKDLVREWASDRQRACAEFREKDEAWSREAEECSRAREERKKRNEPVTEIRRCLRPPEPELPLPPAHRSLLLAEKWAGLSAIHDVHWKGEKVNPWPLPDDTVDEDLSQIQKWIQEGFEYKLLMDQAKGLEEADVPFIARWLVDIEAGLSRTQGGAGGGVKLAEATPKPADAAPELTSPVVPTEAASSSTYDVFLSHNSKDKPTVRELKTRLVARKLTVWLDEDELRPGVPWQRLLEEAITGSGSVAVIVGKDGLGPWEDEEMQGALRLAVKEKRPVIPVLLPGAPAQPELPLFLGNRTWVDLREGFTDAGLAKLVWGITGQKP